MRQSGSKRAAHGARRALHTTQSCYNPATIVADCGFRLDPTAILLQSRSIAARLHHLGPQSCHNREPIVHQSSVHSAQGAGGRVSGFFVEIPGASNRASILHNRIKCFLNWRSIVNKNELQLGNKRKAYGTPNRTCNRVTILHRSRAQCIVHFSGKSPVLKIEPQSCTNLENFVWIGA